MYPHVTNLVPLCFTKGNVSAPENESVLLSKNVDLYAIMSDILKEQGTLISSLSKKNANTVKNYLTSINLSTFKLVTHKTPLGKVKVHTNGNCLQVVCLIPTQEFISCVLGLLNSDVHFHFPLLCKSVYYKAKDFKIITVSNFDIGFHVSPEHIKSLNTPNDFQYFCFNPKSFDREITFDVGVKQIRSYCQNKRAFVHAPYVFNLAKRVKIESAIACLNYSNKLGAKGVVFHCGKGNDKSTFFEIVSELVSSANSNCPFILETPAGQGTEMLSKFTEFVTFCKSIEGLKVCIDTCHVFATGYDPYWYLLNSLIHLGDKIALVHFNDSYYDLGSRKDRHYPPGYGYIGIRTMQRVYELCKLYNIPMVVE